ncbi:spore germination protein [Desulforamulus aquiferis]
MNIWKELKKVFSFESNIDQEGFILEETPAEKKFEEKQKKSGESNEKIEGYEETKQELNQDKKDSKKPQSKLKNRKHIRKGLDKRGLEAKQGEQTEERLSGEGQEQEAKHQRIKKPLKVSESQGHHDPRKVSMILEYNKERIRDIYDLPTNKDLIIRELTIATEPPVQAFVVFMEGLSDKTIINRDILKPLMLLSNIQETVKAHLLIDYVQKSLLPGNQVTSHSTFKEITEGVNYGSTALFIEGCNQALVVETKGWEHRGVDKPQNEMVVRGPQEAFTEMLRVNTGLIRRYVRSSDLTTEMIKVGNTSNTDIAVMYMKNIANDKLVKEVKRRINSIKTDGIVDIGILEQFIEDSPWNVAPQVMATERPDRTAYMLLRGKIAILMDGNPYVLLVPTTLFDQLHSQEDYYLRPIYGSLLRLVRGFAFYVAFLTPGVYLAIVLFHREMIPTELLLSIMGARERVPFPSIIEVIVMEVSFELIREAGVRVPGVMGTTIGIVGALILGQAAVQANIVSPILVIIVAVTGLANFAIPSYSMQFSLRIMRFAYIILGYMLGFVGIAFGLFAQMHMMAHLKSFGVPYLAPMAPTTSTTGDVVLRKPVFSWEKRPDFLNTKSPQFQPKISRRWVLESSKREKKR